MILAKVEFMLEKQLEGMQKLGIKEILQTRCVPLSLTIISALPCLTRNVSAKIFSTVCENENLFRTSFSNWMHLFVFNMSNITDTLLWVSFSFLQAVSSTYRQNKSEGTIHSLRKVVVTYYLERWEFKCTFSKMVNKLCGAVR